MTEYGESERRRRNEDSKLAAGNDRARWTMDEIGLLLTWDRSEAELDLMAELLGRTREACRERYYLVLRLGVTVTVEHKLTVTEKGKGRRRESTTERTKTERWNFSNWGEDERSEWYA